MAWAPLLLVVLAHVSGDQARLSAQEFPGPGSADSWQLCWLVPAEGPWQCRVSVIYWSDQRPSGIPSRFSGSLSASTATLTITGVQAEDEPVYYSGGCDRAPPDSMLLSLPIAGQSKAAPTVTVFPPSKEEMSSQGKATVVCLAGDFYPGAAKMDWSAEGCTLNNDIQTSQPQRQTNNKYMASSYMMLSASEWNKCKTITCKVTHEVSNVVKTLNKSECF
uniref:Ig-like domain-containing protein n=1 Tax=Strix occidentalis caurina TaxID=311401 RepID=A0A8D0F8M9_STROC